MREGYSGLRQPPGSEASGKADGYTYTSPHRQIRTHAHKHTHTPSDKHSVLTFTHKHSKTKAGTELHSQLKSHLPAHTLID